MALVLITGRAGTGKTKRIRDDVRAAVAGGDQAVLLLPTYPDVVRMRSGLAARAISGVQVETLDEYLAQTWRLLGDGRALAGPHQRRGLVAAAAARAGLRVMGDSAKRPGFVGAMEPVLSRLGEYDREDLCAESPLDADLLLLLDEYATLVGEAGLIDRGSAARILADLQPLDSAVFVDGVTDLSPRQQALLTGWARRGADVTIALPWEGGFAPTAALDALVEELSSAADAHSHLPAPAREGELARLESHLFGEPSPQASEGDVVFCRAAGTEAEAALVAERVEALLAGQDGPAVDPGSIAVVFRDTARRVEALRSAFRARGIHADLDVNVPLASTAFGKAVGQLVSFVTGEGTREQLASLARGPFLGVDHERLDAVEASWRRERITDRKTLVASLSREDGQTAEVLRLASRLGTGPVEPATLGDWKHLLDLMLAQAFDTEAIAGAEDGASAARAHGAIIAALVELAEFDPPSGSEMLLGVLRDVMVPAGHSSRGDRVLVTEAHRLRSRSYDALIVGGFTADEFSSVGRPSFALEATQRLTGLDLPSDQDLERLMLYSVVTRARKHLEVVRLTADSEGRAIRPSIFWDELLDLYRPADPDNDPDESPVPTVELSMNQLARVAPMIASDRRVVRARVRSSVEPVWAGADRLESREALAELAARDEFSATELETYAKCPYRWFYQRVVRPRELDQELGLREGGSLAHAALQRFYRVLRDELGLPRVTIETLPRALQLAENVFDHVVDESGLVASTPTEIDVLDGARRRVRTLVTADVAFLPGFAPTEMLEYELADGGSVDIGGFRLRGRVDRVDRGPAGLVVQDYKWSTGAGRDRFAETRTLQLPLYAAAVAASCGAPVVAAVYRTLKDGKAPGYWREDLLEGQGLRPKDGVDEQGARDIVEQALAAARASADGIRSGAIEAEPSVKDACAYCPAASFCPREA